MTQAPIESGWAQALHEQFQQKYYQDLQQFVAGERTRFEVYPSDNQVFAAFNHTPFHLVRVVILGQDPYHEPNQAHGLSFSVPRGVRVPPSLRNIYKEINADLGLPIPNHGNLEKWAAQGVLLLNATLTVRAGQAGSHQKKGWETFTDAAIAALSAKRQNLIFLLWGNYARAKSQLIDTQKHTILTAAHPSPLSASRGFLGCGHFGQTNRLLQSFGSRPIDWTVD